METKICYSFSIAQFPRDGYTIYRRDRIKSDGGLLLYVDDHLPPTLLKKDFKFEEFYVKLN